MISSLQEITESEEYDIDLIDIDLDIFIDYGFSNISLLLNACADDDIENLIINQMMKKFTKSNSYVYI